MQKVLDALTELIDRIRKILGAKEAQLTPEQTEGFRDLQGKAEEMAKLLGDALKATEQHAVNEKNTATEGGVRESIMEIVGDSGKNYGIGVYLDSTLLENLTEAERVQMVAERVNELGGQSFIAHDKNGDPVEVSIAEKGRKFKNQSGKRVPVNQDLARKYKKPIKQESVVLANELIEAASYKGKAAAHHPHDWLDNNGANPWDRWTVFVQDKNNSVWEATLHIANTADGEKILYDIDPIKMVEQRGTSRTSTTNPHYTQKRAVVKRESRKSDAEYLSAVERGDTDAAQRMVDEAAHEAGYTVKAYHGTPNGTFNVFREWSYFTESKKYADVYQNQGASSNGYKQTASNPKTYSVYLDPKNVFDTRTERDRRILQNEFYRQWGNGAPLSERGLPDWTDGDDLIEFFDDKGYDYDAFYLDEGGTGGYGDKVEDRGVSIIVKDSAQVKSADPVTYDDNGNVIPLSERFNSGKKDIRYSRAENQPLRDGADNDTMFSNNVTGGRGNGDHAGVSGQAQPVHSGASSQRAGGPGVSSKVRGGQAQTGRLLHSGPEALQIERKVADYRTKAFIEPAETWENGDAFAYTDKNGVIHIRDDVPASRVDEVMGHELTHVLKRKGFQPYLDFVSRVKDSVILDSDAGNRLVRRVAEHRNIDLTKPLTAADVETISDEIAALVRGAEMSGHVEDIIGELREAFADYDAFARELNEIHEQYVRSVERSSGTRFSRMTQGTEAERRTAALERQNDVLREQVCEAIALENAGDIGVYYIKKGASVPIGAGVQFPRQLQKALASSDGIVMVLYTGFPKKSSVRRRHMERSTPAS